MGYGSEQPPAPGKEDPARQKAWAQSLPLWAQLGPSSLGLTWELLRPADSEAVPQTHGIRICNISVRLIRRPKGDSLQLGKAYLLDVPSSGRPPRGAVGRV